jgi:3-oxoacyl-[acyl-carrier-protein] synthase II
MKMYIRATGNISPQPTFRHGNFLGDILQYSGNRLKCAEPDYRQVIDAKYTRRMSRIIKLGVAAALECLQQAGISSPGAIVTGTAYGCMEDTGIFMKKLVENNETLLTPTAFIQSTHNTIGAQIALILSCNQYNNTFVHRGFSFESALLDAILLLKEEEATNVLVGGADEITDYSYEILKRFGLYKTGLLTNLDLFRNPSKGTIAGEGASFFVLSNEASGTDYALLQNIATFYKPGDTGNVKNHIEAFLDSSSSSSADIDLVIDGCNGDEREDEVYKDLGQSLFAGKAQISYKHLCGEYPTATGFAVWLAANILKQNIIPPVFGNVFRPDKIKTILIYNHYLQVHHSLFLLKAC